MSLPDASNRKSWIVGLRVSRKDTQESGTVIETGDMIKVRWDGGSTSYFRHGQEANVQIATIELGTS
jgi:hypothetical protein